MVPPPPRAGGGGLGEPLSRGRPGRGMWGFGGRGSRGPAWVAAGPPRRGGVAAGEASAVTGCGRGVGVLRRGRDRASPGPRRRRRLPPSADPARAGPAAPRPRAQPRLLARAGVCRAAGGGRAVRGPELSLRRGGEDAEPALESRGGRARSVLALVPVSAAGSGIPRNREARGRSAARVSFSVASFRTRA